MTPSMQNPAYWESGEFPWISSGDVKVSRLTDTSQHVTSFAIRNGTAVVMPANSIILVTRSGILRKYLPVAVLKRPMAINQDIKALIPNKEVSAKFLLHALNGYGNAILARCLKAGTTVESVDFTWLKAFTIPLPPLHEQSAIATALSDVDALLAALDRLIAKKRDLKQAAMQQLLTGQRRLPGFETKPGYKQTEMGMIPIDWDVRSLDSIALVTSGKRLPLGRSLTDHETLHPYIRVTDMRRGTVSLSEIKFVPVDVFPAIRRYRIFKNDIFISVAGTLGIVGRVPPALDGANLTENADRISNITCSQVFLLHVLMSPSIQTTIDSLQTVGAQPKLALTRIRKFFIPLPPTKAEQETIAAVLSDMDAEIAALEARRAKTRELKQAMMQELLTGRTRLV